MIDDPIKRALVVLCALLASMFVGAIIGAWICSTPPAPFGKWKPAKQDQRISGTGTETVKPKDCGVVVAKPAAKQQLDLPPEIRNDPKKHVSSAVIIPPGERYQSVVGIFDESTGKTDTLTQLMEYPLLATEQRGQVWIGYGVKNGGEQAGRILLREDLLQAKAVHAGVNATLDSDGAWFAGVGLAGRW